MNNKSIGKVILDNQKVFEKMFHKAFHKWGSKISDKEFYHAFFECKVNPKTGCPVNMSYKEIKEVHLDF